MSVWADEAWMLGGDGGLTDELVALLAAVPIGLSCNELARRSGRRKADVHDALRWDPRVCHHGRGRGSRWRLASTMPAAAAWEPIGTEDRRPRDLLPPEHGRRAASAP